MKYRYVLTIIVITLIIACLILVSIFNNNNGIVQNQDFLNSNNDNFSPVKSEFNNSVAYNYWMPKHSSFGMSPYLVWNMTWLKNKIRENVQVSLETNTGHGWYDNNNKLNIGLRWDDANDYFKIWFNVTNLEFGDHRITFIMNQNIKSMINKSDEEILIQYTIDGETLTLCFNYSDLKGLGLTFKSGVVNDYFYFRMHKENFEGSYSFDPHFGFSQDPNNSVNIENGKGGTWDTCPWDGTATTINVSFYQTTGQSYTGNVTCAIYEYVDYSSSYAGDLLAVTSEREISHTASGNEYWWEEFTITGGGYSVSENTNYYLMVTAEEGGDIKLSCRSSAGYSIYNPSGYSTPDPWTGESSSSYRRSIVCHVTNNSIYYFDDYNVGEVWLTYPQYVTDGSTASSGWTNIHGDTQDLTSNTCDATDYGDITSVWIRAYADQGSCTATTKQIRLRPQYEDGDGSNFDFSLSGAWEWTDWYNITSHANAPDPWTWDNVSALDCDIESVITGGVCRIYCAIVEIRVNFTEDASWVNTCPTQTTFKVNEQNNNSVNIDLYPQINITTNDADGNSTNIYWSTNGSSKYQINTSCPNGTYRDMNFSFASAYSTKYYVEIAVNDSHCNVTKWYAFTTKSAPWSNTCPVASNPTIGNGSTGIDINIGYWNITVEDADGNNSWGNITCNNTDTVEWQNQPNGTKSLTLSVLTYSTTYTVWLNISNDCIVHTWYTFTTQSDPTFNTKSNIGTEYPLNNSVSISVFPVLGISISDIDGDLMSITWQSNYTGSWVNIGLVLSNVNNGTYYQKFDELGFYAYTYYWRVVINDGSETNTSDIFKFTTSTTPSIDLNITLPIAFLLFGLFIGRRIKKEKIKESDI